MLPAYLGFHGHPSHLSLDMLQRLLQLHHHLTHPLLLVMENVNLLDQVLGFTFQLHSTQHTVAFIAHDVMHSTTQDVPRAGVMMGYHALVLFWCWQLVLSAAAAQV
jgi:hypothetical protein